MIPRRKWMKAKRKVNSKAYLPNTLMFPDTLVRSVKMCWTPIIDFVVHPFIQCLFYGTYGHLIQDHKKRFQFIREELIKRDDLWTLYPEEMERLCIWYNTQVKVYSCVNISGGKAIQWTHTFFPQGKHTLAFFNNNDSGARRHAWLLILPTIKGNIPFIERKYCYACSRWIGKAFTEHIKNCIRCECGSSYTKGSDHPLFCKKSKVNRSKKKIKTNICKVYSKETGGYNINDCWFGDLETFVDDDGKFKVYAACLMHSNQLDRNDTDCLWVGPHALKHMMETIINHCRGVFWFYNGSRFDCFFIIQWCLLNSIRPYHMVMSGTNLVAFTIATSVGEIIFKDLNKFTPGSLKANCASFGLPDKYWKKDFDHSLVQNFADAEKHKAAITTYLHMDVFCLREIYKAFSKVIWDNYQLTLARFVTGSHLGFACFTTFLNEEDLLVKTSLKDEDMMRKLYRGGRVLCGRGMWRSNQWDLVKAEMMDNIEIDTKTNTPYLDGFTVSDEIYDQVKDYCLYIDCNSLYPFAQTGRVYPVKGHVILEFEKRDRNEFLIRKGLNTRDKAWKEYWKQTAACVDVECPNNINIAFLMSRNDKGEVEQDLNPKFKEWYTGPELWEATKLGYVIKRIHTICSWKCAQNIFDDFVIPTYKRKKEAPRDTPAYVEPKNTLNSVTGKFGQRLKKVKVHFFMVNDIIDIKLRDMTEIDDNDGQLVGWYGLEDLEEETCSYPIHLSSFILGWSRVEMSKVMRKMGKKQKSENETSAEKLERMQGAYLEVEDAPIYGDTDSLMVKSLLYDRLPMIMKGDKDLGQMKSEVNGKIIAVTVLAPKTYHYVYIDDKSKKIYSVTKSKGIPHGCRPYYAFENHPVDPEQKKEHIQNYHKIKRRKDNPKEGYCQNVDVSKKGYIFKSNDTGEIIHVCSRIPYDLFVQLYEGSVVMEAIYGGMVRKFNSGLPNEIFIAPDFKLRNAKVKDWWSQKKRIHITSAEKYPTALPPGHILVQ